MNYLRISAIKRDDLTESTIKNQKVCSKHFISGKPALLKDDSHPDWVPSQNMGHTSQEVIKQQKYVEKKEKVAKRKKMQISKTENTDSEMDLRVEDCDDESAGDSTRIKIKMEKLILKSEQTEDANTGMDLPVEDSDCDEQCTSIATQTNVTMEEVNLISRQISFASKRIKFLEEKIENAPFRLMDETSNDEMWKYYTDFDYKIVKLIIFDLVEKYISLSSTTYFSKFNQLLLTLIKLQLNLEFEDLSYNFNISPMTASSCFESTIEILYVRLKPFIIWPDHLESQKNVPSCFREVFHDKTTVIIDFFEIPIERPSCLLTQQRCWSKYECNTTAKFLIGITPQGTISFISESWGGGTSDKQIVEYSNFCNNINPGDIVLSNREFLMNDKLFIPAFTKKQSQLIPLEIKKSRQSAHVRVHVEKITGVIKSKYD